MNNAVYRAAKKAGCTPAESALLAAYVESEKLAVAAADLGISEQTAKNQMLSLRRRLGVKHVSAAVARVLTGLSLY